jgi:tetratricopeptide (TPR) repeat protein
MICLAKKLFIVIFCILFSFGCHPQISKTDEGKSFILASQSEFLLKTDKIDSAAALITAALKLYPGNYVAYNNRAYLKIKQKKPQQEIINDYKKAIELSSDYPIAIYSLANYYFSINDYKNTITTSSKYLSLQLSRDLDFATIEQTYRITGIAEERLLQFDNAIIDLKKSIAINPNDKGSHKELAECYYYGSNDIPAAIAEFTKALEIDRTYYQAYYGREKCYRNNKPPLTRQAVSDSINAEKYDTIHSGKDSIYDKFEKVRKSRDKNMSRAGAFYDSVISLFRPNKVLQQKVVDNIILYLQTIKNDSAAIVNTSYLRQIANEAIKNNDLLLKKVRDMQEVDSTINLKKKLYDYEDLFRRLMIDKLPDLIKLLNQTHKDRLWYAMNLLKPTLLLIKEKGDEFKEAEQELMDKYSLH